MGTRKPKSSKVSAQNLLNDFIVSHGILLALTQPKVSFTNDGQMLISRPEIVAVYKEDVPKGQAPPGKPAGKSGNGVSK